MNQARCLNLLKLDLQVMTPKLDELLINCLKAAEARIKRHGITLKSTADDDNLRVMYAAYLYRQRKDAGAAMPKMLRYEIHQRVFSEGMKTKGGGASG